MKYKDIVVGGKYLAKVSGKITTVTVLEMTDSHPQAGPGVPRTKIQVVNDRTGHKLIFRSAAKLRGPAPEAKIAALCRIANAMLIGLTDNSLTQEPEND